MSLRRLAISVLILVSLLLSACGGVGGGNNNPPPPPPDPTCSSFTATPAGINQGESSTLAWTCSNATVSIDSGIGVVSESGSTPVSPAATTTYKLSASGNGKTVTKTVTVTVNNPPPPPSCSISASPATITAGASSTLTWTSANATSASLDNGIGTVAVNGSKTVTPTATTTYVLTVTGNSLQASCSTTVTVNQPIILSGGENTYTFSGFSTAATNCLQQFETAAYSIEKTIFGNPAGDTAVTVQKTGGTGGAYNNVTNQLSMASEPKTSPDCKSADAFWYGLYALERKHSFKDKWFDQLTAENILYPAYEHVGLVRAAALLEGLYLTQSGTWNVSALYPSAPNDYALGSRMDPNAYSCIRDEGTAGSPVANSNWFNASTGLQLFAAFQESSTNNSADMLSIDFFNRLNNAEYAWFNEHQRLPTMDERTAIFGSVASLPIAGQDSAIWLQAQPVTCASGPDGTYWGITTRGSPAPGAFDIPAITQVGGTPDITKNKLTRSAVTSGTVAVQLLGAGGVEKWNSTFDFASGQEFAFPFKDASGNPFPDGGYSINATWNGLTRQNYTAIIADPTMKDAGGYRGIVVIFVDSAGSVASNYTITTDGVVVASLEGAAIIRPQVVDHLPASVTVNGKTVPVPPRKYWTSVDVVPDK